MIGVKDMEMFHLLIDITVTEGLQQQPLLKEYEICVLIDFDNCKLLASTDLVYLQDEEL